MTATLINRVRIEQTRRELDRLTDEIKSWLGDRRRKDQKNKFEKYQTQLNSLDETLMAALKGLGGALKTGVKESLTSGEVYRQCRQFDLRLVWVRKLWSYFRVRFDQRDDDRLGPVLAAADEVVWSCYEGGRRSASIPASGIAAPLPFLDHRYSPYAHPRTQPPQELRSDVDKEFLLGYLKRLPIPLVSLPPACIEHPWWLVFAGHEVGHHLQYDLMPGEALVEQFSEAMERAVTTGAEPVLDTAGAQRWKRWSAEVFADAYSVLQMGPWAVWAMVELERSDDAAMIRPADKAYPPPAVRLALLAQFADELGLDGQTALRGIDAENMADASDDAKLAEAAKVDLKLAPKIAKDALDCDIGGGKTLRQLCGWVKEDFAPKGNVHWWREGLLGRKPLNPEKSLRAARSIGSGAVAAWAEIITIENELEREEKRLLLRKNLLDILPRSREGATRAAIKSGDGGAQTKTNVDLGDELARILLDASPDQLQAA